MKQKIKINKLSKKKIGFITGYISVNKKGYIALKNKNNKIKFIISCNKINNFIHGDKVLCKIVKKYKNGNCDVKIIKIIKKFNKLIIGKFFLKKKKYYVIPHNKKFDFFIFIKNNDLNIKNNNFVSVKITKRPSYKKKAEGIIVKFLSKKMNMMLAIKILVNDNNIPHIWSKNIKKQLKKIKTKILKKTTNYRKDLRKLPLITIDEENAKDFDDAIYCKKISNIGWNLYVAIADVSYYIKPNTPLDIEAKKRGNSIYFPNKVIPMLPKKLSNNICSLIPNVDRLCLVCKIKISNTGEVIKYKYYEAIIKSRFRLKYNEIIKIWDGNFKYRNKYKKIANDIDELFNIYKVLNKCQKNRGYIPFETMESDFIFKSKCNVKNIKLFERNEAHKLIEVIMVLANSLTASFILKNKKKTLFRHHEYPSQKKTYLLKKILKKWGLQLTGGIQPKPKHYAKLLKIIFYRPDKNIIQNVILRSMKQAKYSRKNTKHFGLSLPSYTHFTSPIRRYTDILVHRVIKNIIYKNKHNKINYSSFKIDLLANHCSMTEKRADKITRYIEDFLKCTLLKKYIGKQIYGYISNVTSFGFFVQIEKFFIDGLVHIKNLKKDYYYFDEIKLQLIGKILKKKYSIGDKVKVKISKVNIDNNNIDLLIK
ncbi:ribonuclease R [Buchnera aphidicola (Taiwanaphis decaspermi)]|uniref:ribonuclease R n=1 Tax=Buchnera aphidicola TaxID=9 RepID=UPI0031B862F7